MLKKHVEDQPVVYSSETPVTHRKIEQISLEEVEAIADQAHKGQVDKLGVDYIKHPRAVAKLVEAVPSYQSLSLGERWLAVASAYLHDVIEDTTVTAADLHNSGLPMEALYIIRDLTLKKEIPSDHYYATILKSKIARIVKIADMAHNADFDRLALLDDKTAIRLRKKYAKGIVLITQGYPEDLDWFKTQSKLEIKEV